MAHTTTADRAHAAALAAAAEGDHCETYGAPRGVLYWRTLVAALFLILVIWGAIEVLTLTSAPAQVADHCAQVLNAGASDHPEALRCAAILSPR